MLSTVTPEADTDAEGTAARVLREPAHRVDGRSRRWWRCRAVIAALPPLVVFSVGAALPTPVRPVAGALLALWLLFALVRIVAMPVFRYRVHRWEVTDDAVYTRSGWLSQTWRIAPLSRIQTVEEARGPLQRRFGLASVTVTTASSAGAIEIAGLDDEVATELAARLTITTQATPGDAT